MGGVEGSEPGAAPLLRSLFEARSRQDAAEPPNNEMELTRSALVRVPRPLQLISVLGRQQRGRARQWRNVRAG